MAYKFIKFIQKIIIRLPEPLLVLLGGFTGIIFYSSGKRRHLAFKNIKSIFPGKNNQEIISIIRKNFSLFAMSLIESLIAPRLYGRVKIKGCLDKLQEGGICVGIHSGSWELINCFLAQKYKYAILAQNQKQEHFDRFLNELRKKEGMQVCFSIKELIKCIKSNYLIGMVIDQGVEDDALAVNFFNHIVPTPRGAVYLARKFNKKIYPCFSYREKGLSFRLEVGKPIEAADKSDQEVLSHLNRLYEDYLTKNPWEYYWCFKRFKYKLNRKVVVLSDGKSGHHKQSQALVSFLKNSKFQIDSQTVDIKYKSKYLRLLADILALFCPRQTLIAFRYLSLFLTKESFESLKNIYADIVISTGSYSAAINRFLSSYLGAKSAVILRPNISLSKFDLAIIPEHDRVFADNAVIIKGALFYPDKLAEKAQRCKKFFNLSDNKKIALFLGGPVNESNEFMDNFKLLMPKLKDLAIKNNYRVLISTSRRTPEEGQEHIKKEFKLFSLTEALVIANETNHDFVFEGFSSLADIVFVTGESISMVTEIASMGKSCVCLFMEAQDNKRKLFLNSMSSGITFIEKPYHFENLK
ncbi:MAG: mitochondrial fission ELM1 family protein, partial [Candidatus Omnitrophica bacterium]|nr:mitochondrial fission ELM1 family protein [Candidatus Omnitrophota bacterium]